MIKKVKVFGKILLLTNLGIKIVLKILFLSLKNIEINFLEFKLF